MHTTPQQTTTDTVTQDRVTQALADLAAVTDWFHSGVLSWPVVRGIVDAVRSLTRTQRRWVDATVARDHRVRGLDPEQLVAAVGVPADQARPDLQASSERRAGDHESGGGSASDDHGG